MRSLVAAALSPLLLLLLPAALADPPTFGPDDAQDYDFGKYGLYPTLKFRSSDLIAARPIQLTWPDACKSDDFFFIAPRGKESKQTGPMILDNDGHMIWHDGNYGHTYGFTVQRYHGRPYLTFWVGDDHVVGHGSGVYYMLDQEYRQFKKIDAKHGFHVDLHEFSITPDNTAVYSVYDNRTWDLTAVGKSKDGWIWDGLFQEMDLETREVLFEWRASDHFTFDDVYYPVGEKGVAENPWDWFHVNSVEKDLKGNYLISSRYTHAISYISGIDGKVLWNLGGKNNHFRDLSDGQATNMAWQHMARWEDSYTTISIYDNHASSGPDAHNENPSRGMKVKLDFNAMTAELVGEWIHPRHHISESQGSVQQLRNGNYFIGFGAAAVFSEFTADGQLVCDMEFGAQLAGPDHSPSPAKVMSYRSFKLPWVGIPHYPPSVVFESSENHMFVSWNGATEVRRWRLEGTDSPWAKDNHWKLVDEVRKTGFETNITVDSGRWHSFKLTALDKNGDIHRQWSVASSGVVKTLGPAKTPLAHVLMFLLAVCAVGLFIYALYRLSRKVLFNTSKSWLQEQGPPGILSSKPRWAAFDPANLSKIWRKEVYNDDNVEEQHPLKSRAQDDD